MAFNAVLEPMLIQASMQVTQKTTPTARRGIFHPGVTFEKGVSQPLRMNWKGDNYTCERKPEKGRPLSRANDQICLDAVATWLMQHVVRQMTMIAVMTLAAARLPVALYNTWIKGYRVGVARTLSTSPNVKINVTAMMNPIPAFRTCDHMIAFGSVAGASLISSAISNSRGLDR
jgi:hypothetical protein